MKYINLIKLLSVLVCMVMLFSACDMLKNNTDDADTKEEATTPTPPYEKDGIHEAVEPVLENFFELSQSKADALGTAERIDGTCVDRTEDNEVIILRTADVDFMNTVTEKFTVYNTRLEKTVLEVTNTYDNGHYDEFDWDDYYITDEDAKYPTSILDVCVDSASSYWYGTSIPYITVRRATLTKMDEEIIEENPDANIYSVEVSYEYYDIAGELITTKPYDAYVHMDYNTEGVVIWIGDVAARFDSETRQLTGTSSVDTGVIYSAFDEENARYGYFFGEQDGVLGSDIAYVEVYDKLTDEIILRHYPDYADEMSAWVLRSGDVLVQGLSIVDEDSRAAYDLTMYGSKYTIYTYILDIQTGKTTAVDTDLVFMGISAHTDLLDEIANLDSLGITLTENVVNFAVACKIENKQLANAAIYVLNNDASVMFEFERIIPEHDLAGDNVFGFEIIDDNYYLVYLTGVAASRAIVRRDTAEVVTYVPDGMYVVGNLLVDDSGIYNFALESVLDFEGDEETAYDFEYAIGNKIIAKKTVYEYDEETGEETDSTTTVSVFTVTGETYSEEEMFDENYTVLDAISNKDYVIFQNTETGKYSLYNAELEHILTTANEMQIFICDGRYIAMTSLYVDDQIQDIFYTIGIQAPEGSENN